MKSSKVKEQETDQEFTNRMRALRHPGEDIRAAKAIYEYCHGEQAETNVKEWMEFARIARDHFGQKNIQDTAQYLEINPTRLQP